MRRLLVLLALRRVRRAIAVLNARLDGRPPPLGVLDFLLMLLLLWLWP